MNEEKETMKGKCCPGGRGGRKLVIMLLFVIAAIFIFAAVAMYLWNAIIPHVFTSVGTITYCQAIGILILSKILFGGGLKETFRGRRERLLHSRQCKEKWMSMSEEERSKFKEEWKNRSGSCGC